MGISLAFHIIFACIGIALPLMMVLAEGLWLRTRDEVYLDLAKLWAKGAAVLFAVGAMSGTLLSFELGLLWPNFMHWAGGIIGLPFALEGYAFFAEAIYLGIYLYGWERVSPTIHQIAGWIVAISGAASAAFVVSANAWMNTPAGFVLKNGEPMNIEPLKAMCNPAAGPEIVHMLISAYLATAIMVAGIHAFMLLRAQQAERKQAERNKALANRNARIDAREDVRKDKRVDAREGSRKDARKDPREDACHAAARSGFETKADETFQSEAELQKKTRFHQKAFIISIVLTSIMAIAQLFAGDFIGRMVAKNQPMKLAALEGQFETQKSAPLRIGGIPNTKTQHTDYAIEVPGGLSLLAFHDASAEIKGLNEIPQKNWPPEPAVHICFQIMVAIGFFLLGIALWTFALLFRKKKLWQSPLLLKACVLAAPLGFVAVEAGWMVTELGRQPWIIYGIMRTAKAATPAPGLFEEFCLFSAAYIGLLVFAILLVARLVVKTDPPKTTPMEKAHELNLK